MKTFQFHTMEILIKDSRILLCFLCMFFLVNYHPGKAEAENASSFRSGSVYCKSKKCTFRPGKLDVDSATAVGTFNDTLLTTGWGILDISSGFGKNGSGSNVDIMFAAGFMEGVFTAKQMELHYSNMRQILLPESKAKVFDKLAQWFVKQRQWSDMMVSSHQDDQPLWRHVGYVLAQLDGLYAGYKSVSGGNNSPLDQFAFSFLNGVGDLLDLLKVLDQKALPDWTKFTKEEAREYVNSQGHCSALIKLLPGFENIFMSHSSWFVYEGTNRIYKHYNFNVDDMNTAAKKISFSSYPGFLESLDDFYLLGSGMVMLQTTINVFNYSLYEKVVPESLLAWQRVRVANMMARDGEQWTQILKKYNSGTYNNEYMLIDLNKFTPKKPLLDGTLWVANQIPGLVVAEDMTSILKSGYYPSYNVPVFEEIFVKSGTAAYVKTHGMSFSYDLAPRASIFRRDQAKVTDMATMKAIMRYNDYLNDSYSGGSPFGAICSRGDLGSSPKPDGCYDTKVADFSMARSFQADIINGPTLGSGYAPFSWTGPFTKYPHAGLPQTYNFGFYRTQPREFN